MEIVSAHQCDTILVVDKRSKLGDVANVVACREVDMFTLRIFCELTLELYVSCLQVRSSLAAEQAWTYKHSSYLEISVFFQLTSIDEVEETVGAIETRDKGSKSALVGPT